MFLDRDGVINLDTGYPHRPEDLVFTATSREAIAAANRKGCLVIVASNQSGVGRGLFGIADVDRFHAEMQRRLGERGAHIDAFYICPYHPDATIASFREDHEDRKPRPGMLLRAMREWPVDCKCSIMIGDRSSDMAAAAAAGIASVLVPTDTCDLHAVVDAWLRDSAPVEG